MNTTLPSWLDESPITSADQSHPSSTLTCRTGSDLSYLHIQYENLFENALDRLALGHQLLDIVDDDPRGLSASDFLKWIKKDKERYSRFKESQELAAEFLIYAAIKAANGNDSINDVNRDKLIVDTSLKIAGAWAPKRYGKDVGLPTGGGSGAITINIGTVDSPYAAIDAMPAMPTIDISDVEVKE